MIRYLFLYLAALAGLALGALIPGVTFLTPLSLALLLFGVLGLWRRDNRPFRRLGFPRQTRWLLQLAVAVLIGVGVAAFLTWTLAWTDQISIAPGQGINNRLPQVIFFTFVYTALIAASEEVIFRGGYYEIFKSRYTILLAALASAALWAIFHLPAMASDQVPPQSMIYGMLSFLGFGVFLAVTKTIAGGSLWVPIGIHYGYNLAFSVLGAFFSIDTTGQIVLMGSPGWVPETGLVGAMAWIGLALIVGLRGRRWLTPGPAGNQAVVD